MAMPMVPDVQYTTPMDQTRAKCDAQLTRRLKERDPEALADLYDRYGSMVYAVALRMVRNASTAEDLVQETFIRIWNGIEMFDADRGALTSWVAAVARNRVLDYLRSLDCKMTQTACELEWVDRKMAVFQPADLGLEKVLQGLGLNQRTVLHLAYTEGLSQSEIAVRMERPVGTVKTWARAALRTLRQQIMATESACQPG
jgi:RNA polymerase sigma-70 factor (ECF subfamily)